MNDIKAAKTCEIEELAELANTLLVKYIICDFNV